MKLKSLLFSLFFILIIPFVYTSAQDIEVIRGDSVIYGSPGDELVLYTHIKNTSAVDQVIFLVRPENQIPNGWTSSLCFGTLCFPFTLDSVATDAGFSLEPVHPGDTVEASVHFFSNETMGTGHIQIQIGTAHNPDVRTTINLTASTEPSAVDNENNIIKEFKVFQNYPNPFNPTTTISYRIPERSNVSVKVYNITGKELAELVNGVKEAGAHNINFNASKLSSGVYFYKVTAGKFSSVRKMILIK